MVMTNRSDLHEKLTRLRSHGITRNPNQMQGECHGPWYYQQLELGFNYRMTDMQAALGLSQAQRIDEFIARRHYLAARYDQAFRDLPLTLPWQHPDTFSAYHLYVVRLQPEQAKTSHRLFFESLRSAGIQVNLHYIPVHTQPYYRELGFQAGDFPEAEKYYQEAVSLPMYFDLSDDQQDYVVSRIQKVLQ